MDRVPGHTDQTKTEPRLSDLRENLVYADCMQVHNLNLLYIYMLWNPYFYKKHKNLLPKNGLCKK